MYKIFKNADTYLGNFFDLEMQGFSGPDKFLSVSKDTMVIEEWISYRMLELSDTDDMHSWLKLLAGKESRKFLIFSELVNLLNREGRFLDFGCGQGHIGILLSLAGYNVSFCDYSDFVVPARIELTKGRFFKANFETFNGFNEFDVVVITQVDYIFDKSTLELYLKRAAVCHTRVIIITTQLLGPCRYIKNLFQISKRLRDRNLKKHGYLRSLGVYKQIGRKIGVKVAVKGFKNAALQSYYLIDFKMGLGV